MAKRLAGVALAAAVGTCALVSSIQTADASSFTFSVFAGDTAADGAVSLDVTADLGTGAASIKYYENEEAADYEGFDYWRFTGIGIVQIESAYIKKFSNGDYEKYLSFDLFSDSGSGQHTDENGVTEPYGPPVISIVYDDYFDKYGYETNFLGPFLTGLPLYAPRTGPFQVSIEGNPFISVVPLPACSWLFGSALLALGTIGYARRTVSGKAAA